MMILTRFAAALLLLSCTAVAYGLPVFEAQQYPPGNPPFGWTPSDVRVALTARMTGPYGELPTIHYSVSGAQNSPLVSVRASSVEFMVRAEGQSQVSYYATYYWGGVGAAGTLDVRIDRTRPVSQHVSTTFTAAPSAGHDVVIELNDLFATGNTHANTSGVQELRFEINGFPGVIPFPNANGRATIHVPLGGWTTLMYWAVDVAGNEEWPFKTVQFRPELEITPGMLEITAPVGGSETGSVSVRGVGTGTLYIFGVSSDSPYFVPQTSCVGPSLGVTCQTWVQFSPLAAGDYYANLYIATDDYHQPFIVVPLHGRGVIPGVTLSPDPLVFPDTLAGTWGGPLTIQARNDTEVPALITAVSAGPGAYGVLFDRCGPKPLTLAPGAACDIDILFTPQRWGSHPGALEVQGNMPGGSTSATLQGFGFVPPNLVATPASLDFGIVAQGSGARTTVQIRNDGSSNYLLPGFSIFPANANFRIGRYDCPNGQAPTTIEPGHVCTVLIYYTPSAAGVHQTGLRADMAGGIPRFYVSIRGEAR